jgi:hypothetical protein
MFLNYSYYYRVLLGFFSPIKSPNFLQLLTVIWFIFGLYSYIFNLDAFKLTLEFEILTRLKFYFFFGVCVFLNGLLNFSGYSLILYSISTRSGSLSCSSNSAFYFFNNIIFLCFFLFSHSLCTLQFFLSYLSSFSLSETRDNLFRLASFWRLCFFSIWQNLLALSSWFFIPL